MLFSLPAYGQQAYQPYPAPQPYQIPGYQPYVQPVAYQVPVQIQPMGYPPQPIPGQYYQNPQFAGNPAPVNQNQFIQNQKPANQNNYNTTSSNSMSPYEQQELALKEARMLQDLENMKESREKSESFRNLGEDAQNMERGYVSKSNNPGRIGGAVRGFGNALKRGAQIAGPAATSLGASVGTFFIIRSMY